jgi:hypothetical protein
MFVMITDDLHHLVYIKYFRVNSERIPRPDRKIGNYLNFGFIILDFIYLIKA